MVSKIVFRDGEKIRSLHGDIQILPNENNPKVARVTTKDNEFLINWPEVIKIEKKSIPNENRERP